MKIIEKDKGDTSTKGWSITMVCSGTRNNGCGATLLVEESDLYQLADLLCDTDEALFKCIACGAVNKVKAPAGVTIKQV